ncbi:SNF1-related protein kinase regulatory subunit gamma-like PV42a [Apostasia shenzhenica]|uniref:SNF1-related protein kinase regulatory subunit gamma-like PV42a n=1 Tax=Apostasia shenzhenica TaxID=1088818 RepID=A0A2I0AAW3_9ASPA|nr:SNF1-related protein kinase regulatory subunit gamma-like PV42a [Apostasia shenzhenica]
MEEANLQLQEEGGGGGNRLTKENDGDGDGDGDGDVNGRKKKLRRGSACGWLRDRKIRDLVRDKRRLVEVPCNASVAATVNALVANGVVAVPVAAPPGRYIGAGGSMILESDRATGAIRKHYIGIVTMLDVLVHIAEGDPANAGNGGAAVDLDGKMAVPVSSLIGHSLEGLSLWTLNPKTRFFFLSPKTTFTSESCLSSNKG